jgi:hypothetical protein
MVTYVCDNAFNGGLAASVRAKNPSADVEAAVREKKEAIFNALDHLIPGRFLATIFLQGGGLFLRPM